MARAINIFYPNSNKLIMALDDFSTRAIFMFLHNRLKFKCKFILFTKKNLEFLIKKC